MIVQIIAFLLSHANAEQCPGTTRPYIDPANNQIQNCQPNNPNSCPSNFFCWFTFTGTTPSRYYCCGAPPSNNVCPNTFTPVMNNGVAQRCANYNQGCPVGAVCLLNNSLAKNYCCTKSKAPSALLCPSGRAPLNNNQNPVSCNPGSLQCPVGFECAFITNVANYYCCPQQQNAQCPSNQKPFIVNGQVQRCVVGTESCPVGFGCVSIGSSAICCGNQFQSAVCGPGFDTMKGPNNGLVECGGPVSFLCVTPNQCKLDVASSKYYCCRANAQTLVCPNGQISQQNCNLGQPNMCSFGYSCIQTRTLGSYACCKMMPALSCPDPMSKPFFINGLPQICTSASFCPAGYSCQRSPGGLQSTCCSGSTSINECPVGQSVYMINNQPQTCNPVIASCPSGYICIYSATTAQYVCCGSGIQPQPSISHQVVCKNGEQPFSMNGQVVQCNVNQPFSNCPVGFVCTQLGVNVGCCKSTSSTRNCPTGMKAATVNGQTYHCQDSSSCPTNYFCMSNSSGARYCCSAAPSSVSGDGCPIGRAYLYPGTALPVLCTRGTACPVGYVCSSRTDQPNVMQCCQKF